MHFNRFLSIFVPHLYRVRYKYLLFIDHSAEELNGLNNVEQP